MVIAQLHLMSQIGRRLTLTDLAELVGKAHGSRSFSQGQMTGYQKGSVAAPLDVIWAYAKATRVDPGWLAFGGDTAAPGPPGYSGVPDAPATPAPRPRGAKKRS